MSHISEQLDGLVRQIERYEQNPKAFTAAAFLSDLSNLTSTFDLIRHHDERKKELDQRLYHHICSRELESSHLRYVALHLLATAFEFYANRGGPFEEAYAASRAARRDATNDTPFLQSVLLPKLFDPVNLNIPIEVRFALLLKVAQLQNDGEDAPIFDETTPLSKITQMTREMFALGLARRWLARQKANLSQDGRTIENKLFHNRTFEQVARFDTVMAQILGPGCLNYTVRLAWYRRLGRALAIFLRRLWAGLLNLPYVFGQARPAFYVAAGLLVLVLTVWATFLVRSADRALWAELRATIGRPGAN
jgi:hypothetical protein